VRARISITLPSASFALTGELQELAMANGWSNEYMVLSDRADAPLGSA
jgi:hypothetical protein